MTKEGAIGKGYYALTIPYKPEEKWMENNVVLDMERGGIDYVLIELPEGTEVWRR